MALTISLLDPQSPTLLRVVTTPILTDTATFALQGEGNPIVFNRVRLADNSVLLLVLGAVPYTYVTLTVTDTEGTATTPYQVPADAVPNGAKVLEAITYAFGKQFQNLHGVPACVLKHDFGVFDTVMHVDSTLGFPSSGWLRLSELVLEYTSRTAQSFTLRQPALRYPSFPRGTPVYSEVRLLTPDGAGFGTESL